MTKSRTRCALEIYDTDDHGKAPGITPYKAALIAGIAPQALYAALRRREQTLQSACPTCGTVKAPT